MHVCSYQLVPVQRACQPGNHPFLRPSSPFGTVEGSTQPSLHFACTTPKEVEGRCWWTNIIQSNTVCNKNKKLPSACLCVRTNIPYSISVHVRTCVHTHTCTGVRTYVRMTCMLQMLRSLTQETLALSKVQICLWSSQVTSWTWGSPGQFPQCWTEQLSEWCKWYRDTIILTLRVSYVRTSHLLQQHPIFPLYYPLLSPLVTTSPFYCPPLTPLVTTSPLYYQPLSPLVPQPLPLPFPSPHADLHCILHWCCDIPRPPTSSFHPGVGNHLLHLSGR